MLHALLIAPQPLFFTIPITWPEFSATFTCRQWGNQCDTHTLYSPDIVIPLKGRVKRNANSGNSRKWYELVKLHPWNFSQTMYLRYDIIASFKSQNEKNETSLWSSSARVKQKFCHLDDDVVISDTVFLCFHCCHINVPISGSIKFHSIFVSMFSFF